MKMIVVKILVVLVAIISVALVTAMFTKKHYTLSRTITIDRPVKDVFAYIKLLKNQKAYSKWLSVDPATKISYSGAADGMPGAVLAFDSKSNKTGKGEWEIKQVTENERLDFELRFLAPFQFTANGYMAVSNVGANETRLTWIYNSGMNWPNNLMLLLMDVDKVIGNDIGESLGNIKRNLEAVN